MHRHFSLLFLSFMLALSFSYSVSAQEATSSPPEENVSILLVQTAANGSIVDNGDGTYTLALANLSPTIWFTDRPAREAGHMTTGQFLDGWNDGVDSFAIDPPNAVLEIGSNAYALELLEITYHINSGTLTYQIVPLLEVETTSSLETAELREMTFETAALFIDAWVAIYKKPVVRPTLST